MPAGRRVLRAAAATRRWRCARLPRLAALRRTAGATGRSARPVVAAALGIALCTGEIDAIARHLAPPGIWLLHGAYALRLHGAGRREQPKDRSLRRTLDWPFPGLGRLVEVVRQRGPAGDYPERHLAGLRRRADGAWRRAASPRRSTRRRCGGARTACWLLWLDYVLNALSSASAAVRPLSVGCIAWRRTPRASFSRLKLTAFVGDVRAGCACQCFSCVIGCAPASGMMIERRSANARGLSRRHRRRQRLAASVRLARRPRDAARATPVARTARPACRACCSDSAGHALPARSLRDSGLASLLMNGLHAPRSIAGVPVDQRRRSDRRSVL